MKDLTAHSIGKLIPQMALPIAAGMLFQTLYFLIDLYFVAHLRDAAIAGVSAAGNVMFIIFALTQVLGVGTVALISHAVGRKDQADATRVFNQSFSLSAVCGLWYISLVSMTVQAIVSLWLVRSQLRRRMPDAAAALEAG